MRFRGVIFDCDSTLSGVEGIDELAVGCRAEVAALTDAAMRGEIALEQVYGRRLDLVRPTRAAIDALAVLYIDALVPDAREVVAALRAEGIVVRIVSGGVRQAIIPMARALGLDVGAIAAVDLRWNADGSYAGFDMSSPLARSGGKREVIERWRSELGPPLMMVGDGVTDLEARPVVNLFVAYAGVVARPQVIKAADVVLHNPSLAPVVTLALDGDIPADAGARILADKGARLLALETTAHTR
jgi:phosphoserine phosphatase